MVQRETVLFSRESDVSLERQNIEWFVIYLDFSQNSQMAKANKLAVVFGTQATTTQLYLGQDTFEFDQGHLPRINLS